MDEDQERFEDYLQLERYIEELQAGHVAHPPRDLTPAQARIYRMAALFRSALPEAATPRPEFVESLRARLLALDQEDGDEDTMKRPAVSKNTPQAPAPTPAPPQEVPPQEAPPPQEQPQQPAPPPLPAQPRRARFVSRRSLLTGGAVAAASLAAGVGLGDVMGHAEAAREHVAASSPYPRGAAGAMPLVPDDIAATWAYAGTLAQLGNGVLRFATDTMVGYVIRDDGSSGWNGSGTEQVIALSAACTHMGCLIQWQSSDNLFHCPCHGGMFDKYGQPVNAQGHLKYMVALPRMDTKIVNGEIYVRVPKGNT